jgi:ATP-dependent helicase/nuclease subunit A
VRVRVASAGTGKTTSLVLRYLELIGAGTPVRRIGGMTFTRSAAGELRQRVREALGELLGSGSYLDAVRLEPANRGRFEEALLELDGATLTTIHGFMIDALRLAAPSLGLDPDFGVLAEWEAQALFEEEVRSLVYLAADPGHPRHAAATALGPRAEALLGRLFAKRSLTQSFTSEGDDLGRSLIELWEAAYGAFERRLGGRMLPPGEVERRALRLVAVPAAVRRVAERYRVALVDEFQDVNPLQGRFFEALEGCGLDVEVVGDPKQSIYGFRSGDVQVFRRALAQGEELPPLGISYRHGELVNRFLNRLTETLAGNELGFGPREAPQVSVAAERAGLRGRIEVHWVVGDEPLARLRDAEAGVLAQRLEALHRELGVPYDEMAVLARSHHALAIAEAALHRAGLPALLVQGRGYFERIEIRDLYNALRAGIEPAGISFAAWLRGPFGRLSAAELESVLGADDAELALARCCPAAAERYRGLRELVLRPPLEALKLLIREPLIDGRSFVSYLDARQRQNVDALLFTAARQPPGDLEVLLDRLEQLVRQTDAGDVPQSGDGIKLLTVHAAKGLEWRVTAVFDLGRRGAANQDELRVEPGSGAVSFPGSEAFARAGRVLAGREEAEGYRLLYVAASRPKEILLLTGSARRGECHGWARALELMGLGPGAAPRERDDFVLATHSPAPPAQLTPGPQAGGNGKAVRAGPTTAPEWLDASFSAHPYPPIFSPSSADSGAGFGEDHDGEPRSQGGGDSQEAAGRSTAIGTLVHYAISQSWSEDDPRHVANLRAQEVMFPFSVVEQDEILVEVGELLANYRTLLGHELPRLEDREQDEAELPMALPVGATVWQGVIDRLYRSGGRWYLDDYKTDRQVTPERYLGQLALYAETVRRVRGVRPTARLVYLRRRRIVELEPSELEVALSRISAAVSPPVHGRTHAPGSRGSIP